MTTKYPEYIEAGAAVKNLISLVRGGSPSRKQFAKDVWVISGYAIDLTVGEPDSTTPPGTLKLSRPEDTPTLDDACDTLTAAFNPELRAAKSMPLVVSSILVVLQAALTRVPPPWGPAISAAITAILAAAGQ